MCRKHHNKLIVNAMKKQKTAINNQECSHPKHREYSVSSVKDTKLRKAPVCLIEFFNLPTNAMICNHCLYSSDNDKIHQDYPHPISKPNITLEDKLVLINNKTYALRSDILYTADEYRKWK